VSGRRKHQLMRVESDPVLVSILVYNPSTDSPDLYRELGRVLISLQKKTADDFLGPSVSVV
jgi:hypothetical protein